MTDITLAHLRRGKSGRVGREIEISLTEQILDMDYTLLFSLSSTRASPEPSLSWILSEEIATSILSR